SLVVVSQLFLIFLQHTPPTQSNPLSLHDALPISTRSMRRKGARRMPANQRTKRSTPPALRNVAHPVTMARQTVSDCVARARPRRSEEHTSELQSRENLVCRLLLEKKKKNEHEHKC